MSTGYGYGWTGETEKEAKERRRREREKAKSERDEAARWKEQGYISHAPRKDGYRMSFDTERDLLASYWVSGRALAEEIEETASCLGEDWSGQDQKRIDKAIVMVKVGLKFLEKAMKPHGFQKMKVGVLFDKDVAAPQPLESVE